MYIEHIFCYLFLHLFGQMAINGHTRPERCACCGWCVWCAWFAWRGSSRPCRRPEFLVEENHEKCHEIIWKNIDQTWSLSLIIPFYFSVSKYLHILHIFIWVTCFFLGWHVWTFQPSSNSSGFFSWRRWRGPCGCWFSSMRLGWTGSWWRKIGKVGVILWAWPFVKPIKIVPDDFFVSGCSQKFHSSSQVTPLGAPEPMGLLADEVMKLTLFLLLASWRFVKNPQEAFYRLRKNVLVWGWQRFWATDC